MGIRDTVRTWIVNLIGLDSVDDLELRKRIEHTAELRAYYEGMQKEQLRVKFGKFNDNLTVNLISLIVDKAVSALVGDPADGHGLSWTFPSETTEKTADGKEITVKPKQILWLDEVWKFNKQEILLHKNALIGAQSGVPCIKMVPDGAGNIRLINVNPLLLSIETDPQDQDKVIKYTIRYTVEENGKQVQYIEETTPANEEASSWLIGTKKKVSNRRWEIVQSVSWAYPFPDILHWQNLPVTDSPYGRSDIEGVLGIQDRYNFVEGNLSKIIRLFAHPQRFAKNLSAQMQVNPKTGETEFVVGPDEMPAFQGEGEIIQLPPVGDLPASIQFKNDLRELMFSIAREVDTSQFKDKVGAITNMGLRMMYKDALEKLGTKRMLYGQAYQELNRRLLVLGGFEPETCIINWPDPLPVNVVEETTALQADMNMGLVSKQTAQEMRGYDAVQEQDRMAGEKSATDNAGGLLLQNFFSGVNKNNQP